MKKHSWSIVSENIAIKKIDKSAVLHRSTGIPLDIRNFFDIEQIKNCEKKGIVLCYDGKLFQAYIEKTANGRTRMTWKKDFADRIQYKFPELERVFKNDEMVDEAAIPKLRFQKIEGDATRFEIGLLQGEQNIGQESLDYYAVYIEGEPMQYFVKRYERSTEVREAAIKIHGTTCYVCGFNFGKVYGEKGEGFIEIHHVKPLSTLNEAVEVNPATDVVPLCANCHRIVHRNRQEVLDVDELKKIVCRVLSELSGI